MKDAASLLPLVAIALIFWLLIIRPASRQRKQVAALQAALQVGDNVILTSGIFATIVGITEDYLEVEVAPGVVVNVVRPAVGSVRRDESADEPASEPEAAAQADGDDFDDEER